MNNVKYPKLRGRIAELGMSQTELAKVLGISVPAMNAKMNGRMAFVQRDILKLCDALNISAEEIGTFFYDLKV